MEIFNTKANMGNADVWSALNHKIPTQINCQMCLGGHRGHVNQESKSMHSKGSGNCFIPEGETVPQLGTKANICAQIRSKR